jgi:5-deoxy-D-glucuronate isomerase
MMPHVIYVPCGASSTFFSAKRHKKRFFTGKSTIEELYFYRQNRAKIQKNGINL